MGLCLSVCMFQLQEDQICFAPPLVSTLLFSVLKYKGHKGLLRTQFSCGSFQYENPGAVCPAGLLCVHRPVYNDLSTGRPSFAERDGHLAGSTQSGHNVLAKRKSKYPKMSEKTQC